MIKRSLMIVISLCVFVLTITPAYSSSTLPNEAVFNWVEYKFSDLFPKSVTVKSELTHESVHYDLRSWSGVWGTRYLGITDDGEIYGFGDYTDGELKSFGYVDEWENLINADEVGVLNSIASVSYVVSDVPTFSDLPDPALLNSSPSSTVITEGMDGRKRTFIFPTGYVDNARSGLEFVEISPKKYELLNEYNDVKMGFGRDWKEMDTSRTDLKRFVVADTGLETNAIYEDFDFGYVWVATDYGNGYEFTQINNYKSFYHTIDVHDIDGNELDDIVVVQMGVKNLDGSDIDGSEMDGQLWNGLHTFMQYTEGDFTQVNIFNTEPGEVMGAGSLKFVDLDNNGTKELVQVSYGYDVDNENISARWGVFKIWELDTNGKYTLAHIETTPNPTVLGTDWWITLACSRLVTMDYDNDGFEDLLLFYEGGLGDTALELYRNNGDFTFTRVTDDMFDEYRWIYYMYQTREAVTADVNNDGWDDIILQGWAGQDWDDQNYTWTGDEYWAHHLDHEENGYPINFGSQILINNQGHGFKRLIDIQSLQLKFEVQEDAPLFVRFMSTENGVSKFFGFNSIGAPMVFTLKFDN